MKPALFKYMEWSVLGVFVRLLLPDMLQSMITVLYGTTRYVVLRDRMYLLSLCMIEAVIVT